MFDAFLKGEQITPDADSDLIVVELSPRGHKAAYLVGCTGMATEVTGHAIAIGCGGNLALGAVLGGADTRRALEIAIERDVKCGGEIRLFPIGEVDRDCQRS